jgi:soluble lytic murein transglycosylase-like protein
MAIPHLACMALVASIYHLPPRVLPSIHAIEGGRAGTVSPNTNGTQDLGVMQVNTLWLPALARYTGLSEEEVRARLIDRPCFNIAAAGVILRTHLNESGGDLMRAVGNYHSRTPTRHHRYRDKVTGAARRLFAPQGASPTR